MRSVREIASSLGITGDISIRNVIQELSGGASGSLLEVLGPSSDFITLPIRTEGSGPFRANRFRLYFQHPQQLLLDTPGLVSELDRLFPQLFEGTGDEVDQFDMIQNIATTRFRFDRPFNDLPTLQYTADVRVLFDFLPAPDLHDDWVGFVQRDNLGFTVQTLKREFDDLTDLEFGAAVAAFLGVTLPGGGAGIVPIGAGFTAATLNHYHFLAGRRSWIIAKANDVRGAHFSAENPVGFMGPALFPDHLYVIETAAIERFSSWVFKLIDLDPGIGIGDMDDMITEVWTTLLRNFVTFMGFEPVPVNPGAHPVFPNSRHGVNFVQEPFDNETACLGEGWVRDLMDLHLGIAEQFS